MYSTARFPWMVVVSGIGLLFAAATDARAADEGQIAAALARPVLESGQPLREIKTFIEPRIIKLPPLADRAGWEKYAAQLRRDVLEQIVFRGSAARWRDCPCRVQWLDTIAGGPGYKIRKFRYECLSGMWIPGLLYLPENLAGKVPLAVHVNGHAPEGKAVEYKQLRSINLAKRGMLVLDLEWFGMGQLRTAGFSHYRMNQLDLCGASGLAPFYLAMSRALDLGLALPNVDPKRVAVSGLSGGGWQTILISSLDERVTLANPVAGYGSFATNIAFDDMGDSEQAPSEMAIVADYAHLTALRAPRPTLLTYNAGDDCCFKSGHTLEPLLQAARPIFELYGAGGKLRSHVNHVPGTHNFEQENREQHYAVLGDFFYPQDPSFARAEIPSQAEIKTAAELHVPLPEDNLDFHRLAVGLLAEVPRDAELPADKKAAEAWQRERRDHLIAILKAPKYDVTAAEQSGESWKLKLGQSWTVPAVQFAAASDKPRAISLVVDDRGRTNTAAAISRRLAAGDAIWAVDPLLWGESKIKAQDPDYLYPLFVAAVGERALGIQAAQLAGIARWLRERHPGLPITLVAEGPRSSMAALVATAIEPAAVSAAEVASAPASLKQLIEEDKTVETAPELFAFGLLAEFDIRQIVAISAPRPVSFRVPDDRARRELQPLGAWYALFGQDFHPAR